jgi:hypothetical protein
VVVHDIPSLERTIDEAVKDTRHDLRLNLKKNNIKKIILIFYLRKTECVKQNL